jgi:hypothetical protein
MVDGAEPEFDVFQRLFCGDEAEQGEVTLKYEVRDAMDAMGLVWVEGWDTPVHARCSKKTVCKCVVPVGCTFCPLHQRSLEKPVKPAPPAAGTTTSATTVMTPNEPPKPANPPVPITTKAGAAGALAPSTAVQRATWLPQPTETTRANTGPAPPPSAHQKRPKLPPPPPKKATIRTAQMEAAAKTCAFTLESRWSRGGGLAPAEAQCAEQQGFSLRRHYQAFDTELHGYRIVNGVWGYRRAPDGKFIPTQHGVNVLHEDGTMSPG